MRILVFLALAFCFPLSAMAEEADLRPSVKRLSSCVQHQNGEPCLDLLTSDSLPLYQRLSGDGLMPCLPVNITYVSQAPLGNEILVRVSSETGDSPSIMRLHFTLENSIWKLNLPTTLEAGLGAGWQQRLDTVEQVYLMLKQQTGGALNCAVLQGLVQQKQ